MSNTLHVLGNTLTDYSHIVDIYPKFLVREGIEHIIAVDSWQVTNRFLEWPRATLYNVFTGLSEFVSTSGKTYLMDGEIFILVKGSGPYHTNIVMDKLFRKQRLFVIEI